MKNAPLAQLVEQQTLNRLTTYFDLSFKTVDTTVFYKFIYECVGENSPEIPHIFPKQYAPLAQLVEQLTLNQEVLGSNPRWCTNKGI